MKRVIPVLIVFAAAIAAGVHFYPRLMKKPAPANQLTLSGNIEAHESLVGFKVQGRIVDLPVEEGQQVKQGDLLARLDDADYKQKVRIDEAGVRVRESDLALTLAGTREQEVKASRQSMLDAQADLDEKKIDNDRALQLFAKDEVSAQDRDLAATALKRAEATFKAAQQRYNEAVEGSRKEDIAIARANLNEASANLGTLASQPGLRYVARTLRRRDHRAPGGNWRGGCARISRGHARRSRSHLAARVYRRDRSGQHSLGSGSYHHHRYLSRQAVPRAHLVYLIERRVHAQERADLQGAGHAGLPHQDRYRQSESRTQTRHARRRSHRSGSDRA